MKSNQALQVISQEGIKIHKNNPFKDEIERFYSNEAETTQSISFQGNNMLVKEEINVVRTRTYQKGIHWVKLTQNREKLADLSPSACKILIYIALNIEPEAQKIHIPVKNVDMDPKTFSKAMVEMMTAGIVRKEKREWYWINITLLIIGKIDKNSL